MAFKAVVTGLVKLNAVIDSESFSAYLKPHALINYRNLQAADLKLDAFSLNRFFETLFGFDDQTLFDILKPLDDSVSLASEPANHFYLQAKTLDPFFGGAERTDAQWVDIFNKMMLEDITRGVGLPTTIPAGYEFLEWEWDAPENYSSTGQHKWSLFTEKLESVIGPERYANFQALLSTTNSTSEPLTSFVSDLTDYALPVFLEDTVALQVIFDRQFESKQFFESKLAIDSDKELTTDYSFTSVSSLHVERPTESSYSFLDSEIRHIDLTAGYSPLLLENLNRDELADLALFCARATVEDYLIESVGSVGSVLQIWANIETRYWTLSNSEPDHWDTATVLNWAAGNLSPEDYAYVQNRYDSEVSTNSWYPSNVRTNLVIDTHRGKFGGAADTLLPILDESELLLEKPTSSDAEILDVVSLEPQKPFTSGYGVSDHFEKSVQYSRSLASAFTLDDLLTAGVTDLEKYTEADKGNIFGFESKTAFDTSYEFNSVVTLGSSPSLYSPRDMSSTSSLESTQAQHFYKEINPLPGLINLASLDMYQLNDAMSLSTRGYATDLNGRELAFDFNENGIRLNDTQDFVVAATWILDNLSPYEKEQYDEIYEIKTSGPLSDFMVSNLRWDYFTGKKDGDPIWFVDNFERTVSYSRSFESDCDFIDSDEKTIGKVVESPTVVLDSATAFDIAAPSSSPFSLTSVQAKSISLAPADDAPFAKPIHVPPSFSYMPFFGWGLRTPAEWADILTFIKINNLRMQNGIPSGVPTKYSTVGMWEEGETSHYPPLDSYVSSSWVLAFFKGLAEKHGEDNFQDVTDEITGLMGEGPYSGPLLSNGYNTTFLSDLFSGYYNTDQIGFVSEIDIVTTQFPAGNSSPNNSAFNATSFN